MTSFIIPAYNEELLLGQTLRAVNDAPGALGERFENPGAVRYRTGEVH
jgi:hypothetical protein